MHLQALDDSDRPEAAKSYSGISSLSKFPRSQSGLKDAEDGAPDQAADLCAARLNRGMKLPSMPPRMRQQDQNPRPCLNPKAYLAKVSPRVSAETLNPELTVPKLSTAMVSLRLA